MNTNENTNFTDTTEAAYSILGGEEFEGEGIIKRVPFPRNQVLREKPKRMNKALHSANFVGGSLKDVQRRGRRSRRGRR